MMNAISQSTVVDWDELNRRLRPDFMEHVALMRHSLSYGCIRAAYAHTIPQAIAYVEAMLGGDPKHRYDAWIPDLMAAYRHLETAGVTGYADLLERISTREGVETLLAQTGITLDGFAGLIYFLRYNVIPPQHPLRELLDPEDSAGKLYVKQLKQIGIAGSLDLLEQGRTAEARCRLAEQLDIPETYINALTHRADMRRLPFHSRKTISYLIHSGAASMAALAAIDPQTLVTQVLAYGQTIGKDLRYGMEPASSALIARILPPLIE